MIANSPSGLAEIAHILKVFPFHSLLLQFEVFPFVRLKTSVNGCAHAHKIRIIINIFTKYVEELWILQQLCSCLTPLKRGSIKR